jgi:prophage regulatory protein
MSDNDEEELRNAIDKYINAIQAERRAVDQGDSTKTDQGDSTNADQGDSTNADQGDRELLGARDLEALTGTKAATWRYWASIGQGPASFKLGRRRVWKKSIVREWLAEQENRAR